MDLKTSSLISDLKLAGSFPDGMFAEADYISFLNTGFYAEIVPFIMRHREDFFVTYSDNTYSNTIAIPSNAIGQKLRDIVRVDSSGNFLGNIPRFTYEEMTGNYGYTNNTGFYLEDNSIKFYPVDSLSDTIRLYYFQRPNYMALESACMELTSISGADASGTVPSTWTTSTSISVVSATQPYTVDDTYTISAIDVGAGTITLSSSGFAEDDFICPRGYTTIPKLPLELRDCLIQSGIVNALVSLKDVNGVKMAREELYIALDNASGLLSPRVEGEPKKIVNNSGIFNRRNQRNGWRF